ncbi:Benzoate 4-monooxygenase [Tolypocladium ophioglossoides CBS 100239]|uniref:Benzoate 4-monooxygenase n=1 Tax=Tolypocladium ophioglossoides (strain CBS 100239) TaxID=1163406 RepID=A0A0L0NBP6_TOLOC|nr:Benzoate 4-monooxygenase [Tolypocladium ophioglossoides CBS 100239]
MQPEAPVSAPGIKPRLLHEASRYASRGLWPSSLPFASHPRFDGADAPPLLTRKAGRSPSRILFPPFSPSWCVARHRRRRVKGARVSKSGSRPQPQPIIGRRFRLPRVPGPRTEGHGAKRPSVATCGAADAQTSVLRHGVARARVVLVGAPRCAGGPRRGVPLPLSGHQRPPAWHPSAVWRAVLQPVAAVGVSPRRAVPHRRRGSPQARQGGSHPAQPRQRGRRGCHRRGLRAWQWLPQVVRLAALLPSSPRAVLTPCRRDFYDAFVSIRRGIFTTRDRAEHTRKRKLVSHTFSTKSVAQFEPYVRENLRVFVRRLDQLIAASPHRSDAGEREARVDCLPWFNYLAFDIIGDLAFGAPFGMLASGADVAEIRASPASPPVYAPAIDILNRRGEVSATLGCLPQLQPYAQWLPDAFFRKGLSAVQSLAGIAIARVTSRIDNPPAEQRRDLLARLMEARDDQGAPLGREELMAEALTHLIAGSDTTSNSSCALMNYLARTPRALSRLQAELDAAIPDDTDVPTHEMVRDLLYLGWVVDEALRHHCTSGIGLPRQVPPGSPGVTLLGHRFAAGTVLSVPTYTIHHSKDIWGDDADEYRPERWENATPRQKTAFIPFSHGPRACVGRNLAELEMKLIAATWARRYAVTPRQGAMQTREGFLRKPLGLEVALSRR